MPVRRARLHRDGREPAEILAAWVSVPDLAVAPSRQRYEPLPGPAVRYVDLGAHMGFTADLVVDGDGLVVTYPGLAERAAPA